MPKRMHYTNASTKRLQEIIRKHYPNADPITAITREMITQEKRNESETLDTTPEVI
jgi:hypothetical protein